MILWYSFLAGCVAGYVTACLIGALLDEPPPSPIEVTSSDISEYLSRQYANTRLITDGSTFAP